MTSTGAPLGRNPVPVVTPRRTESTPVVLRSVTATSLPFGLMLYNRVPFVASLYRY